MRVQMTARHCDISDPVRARGVELMEKIGRYDPRVSGAELVFEEEKHSRKVEAVVSLDRVEPIVASSTAQEWMPALDGLFDRLSRQVRRARDQAVDHQSTVPAREPLGD